MLISVKFLNISSNTITLLEDKRGFVDSFIRFVEIGSILGLFTDKPDTTFHVVKRRTGHNRINDFYHGELLRAEFSEHFFSAHFFIVLAIFCAICTEWNGVLAGTA